MELQVLSEESLKGSVANLSLFLHSVFHIYSCNSLYFKILSMKNKMYFFSSVGSLRIKLWVWWLWCGITKWVLKTPVSLEVGPD